MISFQKVAKHGGKEETRFNLQIDGFTPEDWLYLLENQLRLMFHATFDENGFDLPGTLRNGLDFAIKLLPDAEQMEGFCTASAGAASNPQNAEKPKPGAKNPVGDIGENPS